MKTAIKTFWVTNISNRNVTLSDLNVSIKTFTSVNLLDNKHYPHLTLEMLQKSEQNGSLFKKNKLIVHRKVLPEAVQNTQMLFVHDSAIPNRQRSILEIKLENYEELDLTDEEYLADQNPDDPIKPIAKKEKI